MSKKVLVVTTSDAKNAPNFEKEAKDKVLVSGNSNPCLSFAHKKAKHEIGDQSKNKKANLVVFTEGHTEAEIRDIMSAIRHRMNGKTPPFCTTMKGIKIEGLSYIEGLEQIPEELAKQEPELV